MRVNGYGEFQQLRRAAGQDDRADARARNGSDSARQAAVASESGDAVSISPHARLMAKVRAMPDVRPEAVEKAAKDLAAGVLDNASTLRGAVEGFLADVIAGE